MKILSDIDVSGKRVFVRADLDVPLEQLTVDSSQFTEATRLTNLKETIDYLLSHDAIQIVIAGHIDRPEGSDPSLSTKQLLETLEKILGQKIAFLEQTTDYRLQTTAVDGRQSTVDRIFLLENLRFWPGEAANDQEFAKRLAELADIYVNEAFGNCHRSHASMVSLPAFLPHAAGLHLAKEVEVLSSLLNNPQRPFIAIVGGAKIETKLPLVENLAKIADFVLVGGELVKQLTIDNSQLTEKSDVNGQVSNVSIATLTPDTKDIDKRSIDQFTEVLTKAKTIVWNGPMGLFEEGFNQGTRTVAEAIVGSGAYSVVGGGETTQFLGSAKMLSKFSFVSAGGGAMLEFLAGKKLPALEALQ